jgi:hypothetical protein
MFTNSQWISNEFKKIKNPVKYPGTANKYQGVLPDDFDFKYQKENYDKIKLSLQPFNINPTEIYYATRANKPIFVVCFDNPNIFWQKYEGEALGSGQNYIYWKSHKINTTVWLTFTSDEIVQIFNGVDPFEIYNNKIRQ